MSFEKEPNLEYAEFEQRKADHIQLALMDENQAREHHGLDAIHLMHEALPDLNFEDVSIATKRFGQIVDKPFIVSSMTAGHQDGIAINHVFAEAAQHCGWAMGVGSQRRELTDATAHQEWRNIRKAFPDVSLFGNLGAAQLITTPTKMILKLIDGLSAEAFMIHCNSLQECIQPEGTPQFRGIWYALESLVRYSPVPIVIKETGCGFGLATLKRLNTLGIAAVDVSGLGGTHWGRIEGHRAPSDTWQQDAAQTFKSWGIPTPLSIQYAKSISPNFEIWGSGGVRHGLDAAKLFALGAQTVGFAKPMLESALQSTQALIQKMITLEQELKIALFCTGSAVLADLEEKIGVH